MREKLRAVVGRGHIVLLVALASAALFCALLLVVARAGSEPPAQEPAAPPPLLEPPPPPLVELEDVGPPRVAWRASRSVGVPWNGRLVRGVQLPYEGEHWFTWDPILREVPNRDWRRWGNDRLVRVLLRVLRGYAAAHPHAARVGIGDLSRPHGGSFGPRYGGLGHRSHQNGLDVDVYYPRRDGREAEPRHVSQIDRKLSQDLVDRFVAAGAQKVFVGPNTRLRGKRGVVSPLVHHDDHLHVRIRAR